MILQYEIQALDTEITTIDSELLKLKALLDAKRQKQSLLQELEFETSATIGAVALLKEKIQAVSADAIAYLKNAVLNLFDDGNADNGGNQPTGLNDDEPELLCLNGETGEALTTEDLAETKTQRLTYTQAIKNRCSACWGYEVATKDDIKTGFINRTDLGFMEAVNLERTGREFYETVESYLNKLYYNGQASQLEECPDSSRTGQCYELASPLVCLLWEDAPLLGQNCPVTFESREAAPFVELVKVSDAIAYQRKRDGEILCTYVGFEKKSVAKSWQKFLEPMAAHQELREAQRLQEYQWELKITGLSMGQIQRLAKEPIGKAYRADIDGLKPPVIKPPTAAAQPAQPGEIEAEDIVTPLLTPSGSFKVIQIMSNGILDCENLTTGDRLGLRPGAVSLVQKAKKPSQLGIDLEAKPEIHKKYARVKLKADDFYGQIFPVIKETEQGSTLLTHLGNRWFRSDCLEVVEPEAQTTTGNYKGLSRQVKERWDKAGVDPSDLIADMKAKRPPQPEWNAAKYNPVLAAIGADDASDF